MLVLRGTSKASCDSLRRITEMETGLMKILEFSGDQKDWNKWSQTFLARANIHSYKSLLVGKWIVTDED
jgi:hypothetical protein